MFFPYKKHWVNLSLLFETSSLKSLKAPVVTRREQQGTDDAALQAKASGGGGGAVAPKRRSAPKSQAKADKTHKSMKKPAAARKPRKTVEEPKDEKIDEGISQEVGDQKETKPKKVKDVKAKGDEDPKSKVEPSDKKRKGKTCETQPTKPNKEAKVNGKQGQQSRTWAGRWIPTDGPGLERFNAIRSTFTDYISPKVKAPSSLQNAFFTMCNTAFSSLSSNAEKKEFEACAKLQVEKFLATEIVRT